MRGPEVAVRKAPHLLRVAALGDSVTFGWNVSADATWPAQLDRVLHERGSGAAAGIEVLNCGVSGYCTHDEAIALEQRVQELDPDVVVLAYFLNDPEQLRLAPLQRYFETPAWWQRSHLLRLIARTSYEHDVQRFGKGDVYRYLHAPDGPCWPRELEAMDRVRDVVRKREMHTLVAIFPAYPREGDWSDYPWTDLHTQVAAAWQQRGFRVIDMLPVFAKSGAAPSELAVDSEHPNPRGHEIAAGAIADELAQLGWLGAQ
jgi:lysophospholipase L1-like esterase